MKNCDRCNQEYPETQPYCMNLACRTVKVKGFEKPSGGGMLMYVNGYRYPMEGFPVRVVLDATASLKRSFLNTLRLLAKSPWTYFQLVFMRKRLMNDIIFWIENTYLADYYQKIKPLIKDNLLCRSAREIRRVLVFMYGERDWIDCLIGWYQTDFAYRYRIQDILSVAGATSMQTHTIREVRFLFGVYENRDTNVEVIKKVHLLRKLITPVLFFSPALRNEIRRFFAAVNLGEIAMSLNDNYWTGHIFDLGYKFHGKTYQEQYAYSKSLEVGWQEKEPIKQ